MKITKRSGEKQELQFDKISKRLGLLKNGPGEELSGIDTDVIAQKVIKQIYDGISSSELDDLAGQICVQMTFDHPNYGDLAARIAVSNLQKNTVDTFHEAMTILYEANIVNADFYKACERYQKEIQKIIISDNDYLFDYFGLKTLEKSYLIKKDGVIVERPQYMWMRVSISLYPIDINKVKSCYTNLSEKKFIHASPTLFNAGTMRQQNSSCYLLSTEDSISGIYKTLTDCAHISKYAGGIGVSISNIRAKNSKIRSTNGKSDGIVPMLKVYNETMRYVNQSQRRNGSAAIYLEPHHADIFDFLQLKKNSGDVNLRARDLFYAMWISDLFMERVEEDGDWYLFCPDECPGLDEVFGEEYKTLYTKYVDMGKFREKIKARDLWEKILVSQIETGMPYMSYKCSVNRKSNQKHLGTIKSSNLCVSGDTEILTSKGYRVIGSIYHNERISVWNGENFTDTCVVKTGENQKLIKVALNNLKVLECTPYHKFYVKTERDDTVIKIEAKDLKPGMKLIDTLFPVITEGKKNLHEMRYISGMALRTPPVNYDIRTKLRYLEGVCDRQATLFSSHGVEITSNSIKILKEICLLLNTIGCDADIRECSQGLYTLLICQHDINKLVTLGMKPARVISKKIPHSKPKKEVEVKSVIDEGNYGDTFCFKETERGMGIFNGILTGNCNEITLYNTPESTAVCNIATLSLPAYIENGEYNFDKLGEITRLIVDNLNKVIDCNFYPTKETEHNNKTHRPIAIGVQGLYNVFMEMRYPFDSEEAQILNRKIFECIQYNAYLQSNILAKTDGYYNSYPGSPMERGQFQMDMWGVDPSTLNYPWESLRTSIKLHGVRNSLLTALPPTASTSQILGNVESFEVLNNNFYTRRVLSGSYPVINKYLLADLLKIGQWSSEMKKRIIAADGSIQAITEIPKEIKNLYKTTWEISQKVTINLSADRAPFIDHSQSLNIFMATPSIAKLSAMHFYGWKKGLKTGMYYLRSLSASQAEKFSISLTQEPEKQGDSCRVDNPEGCVSCSG